MPEFIKKEDIIWDNVRYIKEPLNATDEEANWRYELILNKPLSEWDVYSYWE